MKMQVQQLFIGNRIQEEKDIDILKHINIKSVIGQTEIIVSERTTSGFGVYVRLEGDEIWTTGRWERKEQEPVIVFRHKKNEGRWLAKRITEDLREYADEMAGPVNFYIYSIMDDRSREYLYQQAKEFTAYGVYSSMNDPGEEGYEYAELIGHTIDDYFIVRWSGTGKIELILAIQKAVNILKKQSPIFTCWECGFETHWCDIEADSFEARVQYFKEHYCGCKKGI